MIVKNLEYKIAAKVNLKNKTTKRFTAKYPNFILFCAFTYTFLIITPSFTFLILYFFTFKSLPFYFFTLLIFYF